jgi:hypothetical protein
MATAPGEPFYRTLGFEIVERITTVLPNDVAVPFARMQRSIAPAADR